MRTITLLSGPLKGTRFDLSRDETTIGRSETNAFMVAESSVSGNHCVIRKEGGVLSIIDLGSTNGTFLNGLPVKTPSVLLNGMTIRLGSVEMLFEEKVEDKTAPALPQVPPAAFVRPVAPVVPSPSPQVEKTVVVTTPPLQPPLPSIPAPVSEVKKAEVQPVAKLVDKPVTTVPVVEKAAPAPVVQQPLPPTPVPVKTPVPEVKKAEVQPVAKLVDKPVATIPVVEKAVPAPVVQQQLPPTPALVKTPAPEVKKAEVQPVAKLVDKPVATVPVVEKTAPAPVVQQAKAGSSFLSRFGKIFINIFRAIGNMAVRLGRAISERVKRMKGITAVRKRKMQDNVAGELRDVKLVLENLSSEEAKPGKQHNAERLLREALRHLRIKTTQLEDQVRLLDQENEEMVQQLKDSGFSARHPVLHADRLPPPLTAPDVAAVEEARKVMTKGEYRLYKELLGNSEVMMIMQTQSRTAVGLWIFDRRIWLALTRDEVVAFASGRKPLAQRVAFKHLYACLYNTVMGELVLAPDRGYRVGRFKVSPLDGNQILAQIYGVLTPRNERSM